MRFKSELQEIGANAKSAARELSTMSTEKKNECIKSIAKQIDRDKSGISKANEIDLKDGAKKNLNEALLDRLRLTKNRIQSIMNGLEELAKLSDPVSKVDKKFTLENKLLVSKVRVPIGVIGIIYESRPNVTVDAASLCLKAGNGVILKGGSESIHSNRALVESMARAIEDCGVDKNAVQILPWIERDATAQMIKLNRYIDLIIPRGGEGLIQYVTENATVPVIKHYKGVCHIYVDCDASHDMALSIIENAKCQRPGVCNAVETVLIHKDIVDSIGSRLLEMLVKNGVEVRGDSTFCELTSAGRLATEDDWYAEYLDKILSIKVVDNIDCAISHIAMYGSAHSDAIISGNPKACEKFLKEVDSAVVYVNASTRFTDGSAFGMGAEIGISTDRIHARGPMGLEELTTYKYTVEGNGQIRE